MTGRNPFGGKNARSLYVPMSETEQEVIHRLIESGDLEVVVHGWGIVDRPRVTAGDAQVMIPLTLLFDRPQVPMPVYEFDLELRTRSGLSLFRERQSAVYDNKPLMIGAGTEISMIWHIGIKAMDPRVVKTILPGAVGLTSRVIDKETGKITSQGNMKLDPMRARTIERIRAGEAASRRHKAKLLKRTPQR